MASLDDVLDEEDQIMFDELLLQKKMDRKSKQTDKNRDKDNLYSYTTLLNRAYLLLDTGNTTCINTLKSPNIVKIGTKKIIITNFVSICQDLNRKNEDIILYIKNELKTDITLDQDCNVLIKGRYSQKDISNVFTKYISKYVRCWICKGLSSSLRYDSKTKMQHLSCNICKSSRVILK
jgi:translation initiation factor 2 subunit 2